MIAGAPPVKVVSVALMTTEPFSAKVRAEPLTLSVSWVPAASGPDASDEPSWVQLPPLRLKSMSKGLPLFHQ